MNNPIPKTNSGTLRSIFAAAILTAALSNNAATGLSVIESTPLKARELGRLGNVGVISTCSVPMIKMQRPLTKEAAAKEWRETVDDGVGPFNVDPMAATVAHFVAAPISIAGQVYAGVKGLTKKEQKKTDNALTIAARELKLQPLLRERLLCNATNATRQPISEVRKPFPAGQEEEFRQFSCVMAGTLAWIPEGQTAQYYLQSEGVQTVLQLEIIRPALKGNGGDINPPLRFTSQVRASLWNVQSGEELAACKLQYQSARHKSAQWARNDAELFRSEVNAFADAVAVAVTQQLSIPSWWTEPSPVLAKN